MSLVLTHFNHKITLFKISTPSHKDWQDLRNDIRNMLGFQFNSYLETMYPCKARLSYHIWYIDPTTQEEQYVDSHIDYTQNIIVFGKPEILSNLTFGLFTF